MSESFQHRLSQEPNGATGIRSSWPRRLLGVGLLAALTILASGCGHGSGTPREEKPVEVIATTPVSFDEVIDYQDYTGRLEAVKTVDIRARVNGYVMEVPFKEGDLVKQGDLLFQIDARQYRADLKKAEGDLKLSEADQNLQAKNTERARRLMSSSSIAREDYETVQAAWEKARASVEANAATADRARIYLDYTRVTAPITGRISRRYVDPGNLVVADTTLLTTIVTEDPLYAYFDVDERTYLDLLNKTTGHSSWFAGLKFPVRLQLANENDFSRSGVIDFIDNRVNATTGTVRMRGVFQNPTGILKAGLFVRIRLPIGKPYHALLIPDEALMSDQGKKYVYVVKTVAEKKEDGTEEKKDVVEYRPVQIGQSMDGLRVIKDAEKGKEGKEGVAEGERIIITGQQRVRAKTKVTVKLQDQPPKPKSPLAELFRKSQPQNVTTPGGSSEIATSIRPEKGTN